MAVNLETLTDLYRHMEWADASVWTSVLASEPARGDRKLHDILYHLHMVQRAFLRVWRGEPPDAPYPTFDAAEPLMQWGRSYYSGAFRYLEAQSDVSVTVPRAVPWASMVERRLGRPPGPTSLGETMLQVAMHSLYHRGQVNARVRQVGGEPTLVDYIAWVWLGRPDADWPAVGADNAPGQ